MSSGALKAAAQAKFARLELEGAELFCFSRLIAEACKCIEWERIAVEVILQIEDAGEAGAGEFVFSPGAVGVLLLDEPGGGFVDCGVVGFARGEQADQAPGSLRSRAVALTFGCRLVVAAERFAEAAVDF